MMRCKHLKYFGYSLVTICCSARTAQNDQWMLMMLIRRSLFVERWFRLFDDNPDVDDCVRLIVRCLNLDENNRFRFISVVMSLRSAVQERSVWSHLSVIMRPTFVPSVMLLQLHFPRPFFTKSRRSIDPS